MRIGVLVMVLGACASPSHDDAPAVAQRTSGCLETTLAWGSGAGEAGLRPAAAESLAWGPQAVAVAPSGEALVVDDINGRVLAVGRSGVRSAATGIARDAEDIAIGDDSAFAVFSPLQGKAWMFEPDGTPAGDLSIDRSFRNIVGLSVESSRRIAIRTAYQEMYPAGSVHAPVALATSLTGKREGSFVLADGRGVTLTAADGTATLHVVTNTPGRRSHAVADFALPGRIDAGALVGVSGTIACARVERVDQGASDRELTTERRAVCVDLVDGAVVADRMLPRRGLYLPRRDVAFGGSPARLAWISAAPEGLVVSSCEVTR